MSRVDRVRIAQTVDGQACVMRPYAGTVDLIEFLELINIRCRGLGAPGSEARASLYLKLGEILQGALEASHRNSGSDAALYHFLCRLAPEVEALRLRGHQGEIFLQASDEATARTLTAVHVDAAHAHGRVVCSATEGAFDLGGRDIFWYANFWKLGSDRVDEFLARLDPSTTGALLVFRARAEGAAVESVVSAYGEVAQAWPAADIFRAIEGRGLTYRYLAWSGIDEDFLGELKTIVVVAEIRDRQAREWALPEQGRIEPWPNPPGADLRSYDAGYQPTVKIAPLLRETDIAGLLQQWRIDDGPSAHPASGSKMGEVILEHSIGGDLSRRRFELTLEVVDHLVAKDLLGVRGRLFAGQVYLTAGLKADAEAVWERLRSEYRDVPKTAAKIAKLVSLAQRIS